MNPEPQKPQQWGVWNLTKKWWVTWSPFDNQDDATEWLLLYKMAQIFLSEPHSEWHYEVRPYPNEETEQ